jgi:hypothetical protein
MGALSAKLLANLLGLDRTLTNAIKRGAKTHGLSEAVLATATNLVALVPRLTRLLGWRVEAETIAVASLHDLTPSVEKHLRALMEVLQRRELTNDESVAAEARLTALEVAQAADLHWATAQRRARMDPSDAFLAALPRGDRASWERARAFAEWAAARLRAAREVPDPAGDGAARAAGAAGGAGAATSVEVAVAAAGAGGASRAGAGVEGAAAAIGDEARALWLVLKRVESAVQSGAASVSPAEREEIKRALNLAHGHWYKCTCGYLYAVGECGGPMQTSTCPTCRRPIGGTSHTLVSSSTVADDFAGGGAAANPYLRR